jgi:hypothetical protein
MGDESAYLKRRYEQESAAALAAACPEARAAHREMARCYAFRLQRCAPARGARVLHEMLALAGHRQSPAVPAGARSPEAALAD